MTDFIFRGKLAELDPDVYELTQLENERQYRKLILIPSESQAPMAVREALGSAFHNIYAEGYPDEESRRFTEQEILDFPTQLAHYRRYSDPRFYKGVEYADVIEELARRRCAELFAANGFAARDIFVNVQPLSGAPANSAVYSALINPGDTILGMNLLHGGHLSHGSSVNRSGKVYRAVHYGVNPATEKIDYDEVKAIATAEKPKIIICGFTSYSWVPDWAKFREIADSVGAILMADISHIAGLVAAKVIPSPVGFAQVITFTTHKTLCGPRAACILTTDAALSRKIDRSVFPGEQGGPHVNVFAALASTFKFDATDKFTQLQHQIVLNAASLTHRLQERGFKIPFGGTNTHLLNVDVKTIKGPDGTTLSGDMAARILDIAGIVLNRNTIPGDKTSTNASGIRMGTTWVTQRGLREAGMIKIADIIADVLSAVTPYVVETHQGVVQRAKIDFSVLEQAKMEVRTLVETTTGYGEISDHGYPHFDFLDDSYTSETGWFSFDLLGKNITSFVNYVFTSDTEALQIGQGQKTSLVANGETIEGYLAKVQKNVFRLTVPVAKANLVAAWLRDLSDGFVGFDADSARRIPGPVIIIDSQENPTPAISSSASTVELHKPFVVGNRQYAEKALPEFTWKEIEGDVKYTTLHETHQKLGAKMVPFAGWDMPVWYTSVIEEHHATRQAAGLFDVSHMGVYQAEGPEAIAFLDSVCGNDIESLNPGESCYTHLLDPHANVIDDLLVYRLAEEKVLIVVNAANDDKDWAWLNAVKDGKVLVDLEHPGVKAFGRQVILRNLRDPKEGADQRVDIALQGPKSRDILLAMGCDTATRKQVMALKRTELCQAVIGEFDLIVSRTGYTGEKMAFELFIHPEKAPALWEALTQVGTPLGLKPCGLGARDSLRTEAGLPLYGHEMSGDMGLGVAEAGFGSYVKVYKPWFIGRKSYIEREQTRKGVVVRFRFAEKGVRMAHHGDPVVDKKGRTIGKVTSCAIDGEGFLTGQAFVETEYAVEAMPIFVYQGSPKDSGKAPAELVAGDRVVLPAPAAVVSRFPKA